MRKSFITPGGQDVATPDDAWLDLDRLARVEITSEDCRYPIEGALVPGAALAGRRPRPTNRPTAVRRPSAGPPHLVALRGAGGGADPAIRPAVGTADCLPPREVVRQQWVFHPRGSTHETEDYRLDLNGVTVLELMIVPNVTGDEALAALAEWRVA